ncbi:MAG: FHA domain-containing protein [bacterium]
MYIVVVEDERGALISEHMLGGNPSSSDARPTTTSSSRAGRCRLHATIYLNGKTAFIKDEGSSNGVIVDEQRIRGETLITEGSQIRVGEYRVFLERTQGRALPEQGINTAIVHPEQAHGKLVVVGGKQAGREILLFEPITTVGRTDENDVTLADVSVSRHHARIKRQDDGSYVVTDLDSSNGTLVHGRRLTGATRMYYGDRVQFGNIECLLVDPTGKGRGNRQLRQFAVYGLLVLGAAIIGALVSLLLTD